MKHHQLPERNGYCFVPWKPHTLRMWMWSCVEGKCRRRKEEGLLMCAVYTVVANNPTASVVPLHK